MTSLVPREGGRYLNPREVITRVQAEFAYVEASEEGARHHVLACVNRLVFPAEDGWATGTNSHAVQLERFKDAARFVHFGDDLGSDGVLLSMLMIPHQPLIIDHAPRERNEGTEALIARCAAALDYEIVWDEGAEEDVRVDATYSASYAEAA